uniref:Zmp:0000000760 n=1 Tax=Scleropages formosus TaxID=113540 RepID=A0A8C9RR17_SCLFO
MLFYSIILFYYSTIMDIEHQSLIRSLEFRLTDTTGVRTVDGSKPGAVAFRVNPSIHLRKTMSEVYPNGLPSNYSIIATFKMSEHSLKDNWDLWQVTDPNGTERVGLRFHGNRRSLDFFYTGPRGARMARTFQRADKLFDGEWHKLALSVASNWVKLLIDCQEVSAEAIDEHRPVISEGYTAIVKRAVGDRSVSVDLQQMELSCDADQAYSEGCCELSNVCGGYAEIGLTGGRDPCRCLHGQPGVQGPRGPKVSRPTLPDFARSVKNIMLRTICIQSMCLSPGSQRAPRQPRRSRPSWKLGKNCSNGVLGLAYQGPQGSEGQRGQDGEKGEKGAQGPPGNMGTRGFPGPPGFKGSAAKPGRPGFIGPPGPTGHVGLPGQPGAKVMQSCICLLSGQKGKKGPKGQVGDKGEQGPQGREGKRGPVGELGHSGPLGSKGVRGDEGPAGFQGPPGPPGPTLPAQHVIEVCKRVVMEQMSAFANSVKRTCATVCPLYGDVPMGLPGPPGPKGPPGPPVSEQGEPGDKGAQGYGLPGYMGDPGPKGQRGRPGRAFDGQPGHPGESGRVGQPGLRGHPGLPGAPGICLTSGCDLINSTSNAAPEQTAQTFRRRP